MNIILDAGALAPKKAHYTDAGYDVFATESKIVWGKSSKIFGTGVHIEIPQGYYGDLRSKSGLMCKHGITSDGTIDCGYSGEICVKLFNHSWKPYKVKKGDKISQIVFQKCESFALREVESFSASERGASGFGSTGR